MKYAIFEILSLAGALLAGSFFGGHEYIGKLKINKILKIAIYSIIAIFSLILSFSSLKTISEEAFGLKLDRACDYFNSCIVSMETAALTNVPTSTLQPQVQLSSREICGRALDSGKSEWSTERSALTFVSDAKAAGEQVDSCRLKIGLPTLREEQHLREVQNIKRMTNLQVCKEALDLSSARFFTAGSKQPVVVEAVSRDLSTTECGRLLGLPSREASPAVPLRTSTPPTSSFDQEQNTNRLPIASIYNTAVSYAHLRSEANAQAEILARLANGTRVTILGERISDKGQSWCRVSINNGTTTGYVASKLVTQSCRLTEQQYQALQQAEQRNAEENSRVMGQFLGALIQNIPKKK